MNAPKGLEKKSGVNAAIPVNPKLILTRAIKRFLVVKTFFFFLGGIKRLTKSTIPSIRKVKNIMPKTPPEKVAINDSKTVSSATAEAGTPAIMCFKKLILATAIIPSQFLSLSN